MRPGLRAPATHLSTSLGEPSALALPGVVMMMGPSSPAYGSAASLTWLRRGGRGGRSAWAKGPLADVSQPRPLRSGGGTARLRGARARAHLWYIHITLPRSPAPGPARSGTSHV